MHSVETLPQILSKSFQVNDMQLELVILGSDSELQFAVSPVIPRETADTFATTVFHFQYSI